MNKTHLTATKRVKPSAPMKRLATDGLIVGRALDFGCGYGFDADYYGMDKYDPHYYPDEPSGLFEMITCNFVLNVIESYVERKQVLKRIQNLLVTTSVAYITIRNDKRALNGTTSIGTWQGLITLALSIRYKCSGYVTYELRKRDKLLQQVFLENT